MKRTDFLPEYRTWQHMKRRCHSPRDAAYPRYGGRGITVCRAWRTSFAAFLRDMGKKPSPRHQIDRINNDGPYSPSNCRWATATQQARNRSSNRVLSAWGKSMTLAEWAELCGIRRGTITKRLDRGLTLEQALEAAKRPRVGDLTYQGVSLPVMAWAQRAGIAFGVLYWRLRNGWTVKRALTLKPRRGGRRSST